MARKGEGKRTVKARWSEYKGVKIGHVKRYDKILEYRVLQNGGFATMPTLRGARKLIDCRLAAPDEVAALKAAFCQWPADGIVRVGVYVDERVAA